MKIVGPLGCIDSISKLIPISFIYENNILSTDTNICRGASIQLNSISSSDFCWSGGTGLSNTSISNPIANPVTTTTYYHTVQSAGTNLVVNGDFSAGVTGFQSDYTSQFPNTTESVYWIGNNPKAWNVNFNACVEHTTGTGSMMMVNGSAVIGARVWSQTITVTPNTNYAFSIWVQSLAGLNPASLRFSINNNVLGDNITAGNIACQWSRFSTTWNSGNTTSAIIRIVNNNTIADGNDFAIDDISFAPVILKQDSVKITVTDPPALTVTPSTSVCPGDTVSLNVSGAGNYSWTPVQTLLNPNSANPSAVPTATTKYYVTGFNLPGCTSKDSVTISLKPKPSISKSNDTAVCTGYSSVPLLANAAGALQYTWSPSTGLNNSSINNPSANPSASTKYYVEVIGGNGCKAQDSINVTVLQSPTVDTRTDTAICNSTQILLNTSASNATTFSWSPVTGLSNANIENPIASPGVTTKYIITASNAACSAKDSVVIDILPSPTVAKSNDTTICNQGSAQLFAAGGNNYSWSPATGLNNISIANPIASPSAPTTYKVLVAGANGCSKLDSVKVNWIPKPTFTINPPTVAVCLGSATTLTASGADAYNWYEGSSVLSPTSAATSVSPTASQQYSVAVRHNFCNINDTLRSSVTVNPLPTVTVAKSNDIDCSNASATLIATGGVNYNWTPTQGVSAANSASPIVTPVATTTYNVNVTDVNGCSKSDSVKVNVIFNPLAGGYNMPNAFTPNGDGKNDCFGIKYWGAIERLDFTIFNRWGEVIFKTSNPSACWDGNLKGIPQPSGTFVYQIRAKTACGEVYKKGTIALMR
jgi:gliding motility-associated-like protein